MTIESPSGVRSETEFGMRWRWRQVRRQVGYLAGTLAAIVLIMLTVSVAAIAAQANRDDARSVDLVLAWAEPVPSPKLIEHCFELYRRGYGSQLLLLGPGSEGLATALRERGAAEDALVLVESAGAETEQLRAGFEQARTLGAASVLIAGDGVAMLRRLKQAGDEGLRPYGTPTPGEPADPLNLLQGSIGYWRYILFGT